MGKNKKCRHHVLICWIIISPPTHSSGSTRSVAPTTSPCPRTPISTSSITVLRYIVQNFPKQRDNEGSKVDEKYSEVMNLVYTVAGKEAMCLMLEVVDDGCQYTAPFKEY